MNELTLKGLEKYKKNIKNNELKPLLEYIEQLEKQLEATEEACIEWKKKYEETNKR